MGDPVAFELASVLASRAQRVGWVLSATYLLGIGFLPLMGGPRYEAALMAGLVLPSIAAVACAFDGARSGSRGGAPGAPPGPPWGPLDALLRGLLAGFGHLLLLLLISLLHGLRAGVCEPEAGFVLLVLGPGAGALLGGLWGAAVGTVLAGRRRYRLLAVLLGLSAPLAMVVVSLVRFVVSPMVFAFDPFVGYFAGPLYEVVEVPTERLLTYRAGTLATVLAALCGASLVERSAGSGETPGRRGDALRFRRPLDRRAVLGLALFGALSAGIAASGARLGHFSTDASIREALGGELAYGRCDVVYAESIRRQDVLRLARECDAHLAQIERFFEAQGPERVTVMLFAGAEQKGWLMGAASTYIAKPWRREVYLQPSGFPHPVLGHELVHVVAGSFGAGPFRIAGPLGGWIPDPGRIEGVAVAGAPRDDGSVDLEEWAAAMRRVELLPPLERVFRLSFLGESSARAYTVAGAFVAWLRAERGADVVRRWYGGESLEVLTGASLGELESRWHARLDAVVLSDTLLHEASARFERPAIFGRQCPHLVDRLYQRAEVWLGLQDPSRARRTLDEVLALDPRHGGAALLRPACTLREGRIDEALHEYRALARDTARTSVERAHAWEGAGDAAFLLGDDQAAFDAYTTALDMTLGEHARRSLEVKRWALRAPARARRGIELLLVGPATTGPQWDLAAPVLGSWMQGGPENPMARYLIGKNLLARGHYFTAAALLETSVGGQQELPLESVRTEALRAAMIARCALFDPSGAQRMYELLVREKLTLGQRRGLARIAERCGVVPGVVAPRPQDTSP